MATPIPLPEQSILLGIGVGRVTPFWDQEKKVFVPVTEAQFTLSFDHRVLDGGAAGRLLQRVSNLLGTPEEL
jgi:pyruvate/2-oxoglutarate dehydrogenase complex dihydrolipoamide acyltransferase (E2) component